MRAPRPVTRGGAGGAIRHHLNGVDHPVCHSHRDWRQILGNLPSTRPLDSPSLPPPQEPESWYLAKVFILLATVTVVVPVGVKASVVIWGHCFRPREVTAPFLEPLLQPRDPITVTLRGRTLDARWDLKKARQSHTHLHHHQTLHLPRSWGSRAWKQAEELESQERNFRAVFSVIVKTKSSEMKIPSPPSLCTYVCACAQSPPCTGTPITPPTQRTQEGGFSILRFLYPSPQHQHRTHLLDPPGRAGNRNWSTNRAY